MIFRGILILSLKYTCLYIKYLDCKIKLFFFSNEKRSPETSIHTIL